MARRAVRIAYALVDGGRDYHTRALSAGDVRRRDLVATVAALDGEDIDLLVFPAGYFQIRDATAQRYLMDRLASEIKELAPSFGLVVGIDRRGGSTKRATKRPSADGHPYFALYRSSSGAWTTMQQVSVNAKEGTKALVDGRWHDRDLLLPETDIAFLICGESWSNELLGRVAESGCRALVIAAHRNVNLHRSAAGYGKLSWHRRLSAFSRRHRVTVVLAEHTRSPERHPYAWPAAISSPLPREGVPNDVTVRLATISG